MQHCIDDSLVVYHVYTYFYIFTYILFFSLPLDSPIAVIGDASASMQVAIKTSSIIAGLLSAITQAKLSFFNTKVITPDKNPESIEEVSLLGNVVSSPYTWVKYICETVALLVLIIFFDNFGT